MAKKTVYITLTSALVFGGVIKRPGTVVECTDAKAKDLLHRGRGKLADVDDDDASSTEKPLAEHTLDELREIAADLDIDNVSKHKKGELISLIEAAEAADE